MANVTAVQTLLDGPRNLVVKATGILDTGNVSKATLIDVSALIPACEQVRIDEWEFTTSAGLSVNLYWDATSDVLIGALTGMDHQCFKDVGGLTNTRAAGYTGDIEYETAGYTSGTVTYTLVLKCVKQGVEAFVPV